MCWYPLWPTSFGHFHRVAFDCHQSNRFLNYIHRLQRSRFPDIETFEAMKDTLVFEKPYSPSALWIRAAGESFEQLQKFKVQLIVGVTPSQQQDF